MASLLLCAAALAASGRPTHHVNTFAENDLFDLAVFASPSERFTAFNDTDALIWRSEGFTYSQAFAAREESVEVALTDELLNNGTFFVHLYVTKSGASPDPRHGSFDRWATTYAGYQIVEFGARNEPIGLRNLLTGEPAPWEAELRRSAAASSEPERYISYWKPKLHVQLLVDTESYPLGMMPPLMQHFLLQHRLISGHRYRPLVYINELTSMRLHWIAINSTRTAMPLELSFGPLPTRRFQWMVNLQHTFKTNEETLGISEKESEDLRGMFVHTNPVLLYTTVGISALHLLFDVLAFKNDISFWNSVDTMEGLSSRTLVLNQGMEVVILLYLFEEDASWLVKVSSIFTLVLGVFKIFKSLRVKKLDAAKAGSAASLTDEIDRIAFKYLSLPLLLLVLGYSGHSLYTGYHKGWYSWAIESLVALVYGGGFIVMTPQLFINYRLKSVAHLPWKFFMYKALNTFIDDLFAFIIKMPTLHRMSCFRDDIVFVVFLYQRWVYRVDMSRVNEFGHRGEAEQADDAEPAATKGKKTKRKTQ